MDKIFKITVTRSWFLKINKIDNPQGRKIEDINYQY